MKMTLIRVNGELLVLGTNTAMKLMLKRLAEKPKSGLARLMVARNLPK